MKHILSLLTSLTYLSITLAYLATAQAQRVYENDPPRGKTYTYKEVDGVAREIEIYFPGGKANPDKQAAGIVLFHGGGWGGGNRVMFSYQCDYFARRGLVAATVTYRLATKADKQSMNGKGSFKRLCIPDAKSAIRWFKQHANELGVNPQRVIVGGGSAGGHISLIATNNPGLNGAGDAPNVDTSVAAYVLFNPALSAGDAKDSEINFIDHLKGEMPPAIAFFGSRDNWLKGWKPAHQKWQSLKKSDLEVHIADGQGHGFFNKQPWADLTLIAADDFLRRHGFLEGQPSLKAPETGERLVPGTSLTD